MKNVIWWSLYKWMFNWEHSHLTSVSETSRDFNWENAYSDATNSETLYLKLPLRCERNVHLLISSETFCWHERLQAWLDIVKKVHSNYNRTMEYRKKHRDETIPPQQKKKDHADNEGAI